MVVERVKLFQSGGAAAIPELGAESVKIRVEDGEKGVCGINDITGKRSGEVKLEGRSRRVLLLFGN